MSHTVESIGYDRESLFPKWYSDVTAGRALCCHGARIEAAQDRVAMRRYIRSRVPSLARILRDLDSDELAEMVDQLKEVYND